jgi:hypothetical protein
VALYLGEGEVAALVQDGEPPLGGVLAEVLLVALLTRTLALALAALLVPLGDEGLQVGLDLLAVRHVHGMPSGSFTRLGNVAKAGESMPPFSRDGGRALKSFGPRTGRVLR